MIIDDTDNPIDVGVLLSEPTGEDRTHNRAKAEYKNNSDRFQLRDKNFQRQYAHIYAVRLMAMRKKVEAAAVNNWGNGVPIRKLHELKCDERCVVVGTLFKHMELKPCILRELSEEHMLLPPPPRERFTEDGDQLILEDELQRIVLTGAVDVHQACTGAVLAVLGCEPEDDRGKFHVESLCYQELPAQVPRPQLAEDKYVALVSGLECGRSDEDALAVQMMVDVLTGQLGEPGAQRQCAGIVRTIVVGNSLARETQDKDSLTQAKYLSKKTEAGSVEAVKALDDILVQLAACMEVDIMAGEYDPANYNMPQQPLHRCMFPQAVTYPTMQCVTNPYDLSVDGVRFMGTSGQPVRDIYRYSTMEDYLQMLELTLTYGHLAPTAPDTLGSYPFYGEDPFIIDSCPHVYFTGNAPSFQHKIHKGADGQEVLVVTVPRFSKTATCVLVNLRTLECQPLTFKTSFPSAEQADSPEVDK